MNDNDINGYSNPYLLDAEIRKKCRLIKILITDVDGVLTDGGIYYTDKGDTMKKFHVRDGMGVTILRKNNISTILLTKEKTRVVKKWATKMKVAKLYDGIVKKELLVDEICKKYQVKQNELAYIGDDVNDVKIAKSVGFSVVPNDGIIQMKEASDYVCKANGGEGVLREIADLILTAKYNNTYKLY